MPYHYSTQPEGAHAKAVGKSLPISLRQATVISHVIRGQPVKKAKAMLERVLKMEEAVPYFRFNHNIGHRPGKMGPGRYPLKASHHILVMLKSAEANATSQGMSSERLYIKNILAQQAQKAMRGGRHRGQTKRCHVEVVVQEAAAEPAKKAKPFTKKGKGKAQKPTSSPHNNTQATP